MDSDRSDGLFGNPNVDLETQRIQKDWARAGGLVPSSNVAANNNYQQIQQHPPEEAVLRQNNNSLIVAQPPHSNAGGGGGGDQGGQPTAPSGGNIDVPLQQQQQQAAAVRNMQYGFPMVMEAVAWIWVLIFLTFLGTFIWQQISFAPTYSMSCDRKQKVWVSTLWAAIVVRTGATTAASLMLAYRTGPPASRRPRWLGWINRILDLFCFIWLLYGIDAVFFPPDDHHCNVITKRWCYAGFILQTLSTCFPCILMILCLPLILVVLQSERIQAILVPLLLGPGPPPTSNQIPTPEEILNKIETVPYASIASEVALAANEDTALRGTGQQQHEQQQQEAARQFVQDALPTPLQTAVSQILTRMGTAVQEGQQLPPSTASIDLESGGGPGTTISGPNVAGTGPTKRSSLNRNISIRGSTVCPICYIDFAPSDVVMCLPCDRLRHIFHEDCLKEWLAKSQLCPMCRASVVDLLSPHDNDDHHQNGT